MNNKDTQNMITTKIQGTDFTYNKETHYEKDGHIYCKTCNERIDGKPIPMLDKKLMIIRNAGLKSRRKSKCIYFPKFKLWKYLL